MVSKIIAIIYGNLLFFAQKSQFMFQEICIQRELPRSQEQQKRPMATIMRRFFSIYYNLRANRGSDRKQKC